MNNLSNPVRMLSWSLKDIDPLSPFKSAFKGRKNTVQSYFEFYIQSGIFEFFGKRIRKKYGVPSDLDPNFDLGQSGYNGEDVESYWLATNKHKKEILDDINNVVKLLSLPRNSIEYILYFALYEKPIKGYPIFDIEFIENIQKNKINEYMGYSPNEIKTLAAMFVIFLQSRGQNEELLKKFNDSLLLFLSNYKRKIRPLRQIKKDIEVIKKLRIYKRSHKEENFYNQGYDENQWEYKANTSQYIVQKIDKNLYNISKVKKEVDKFRKQVERLLKKYPFLQELLP